MTKSTKYAGKLKRKKRRLAMWLECEAAIATGQSYTIGDRALTRANLGEVEDIIRRLEDEVAELEAAATGGKPRKAVAVVPQDW